MKQESNTSTQRRMTVLMTGMLLLLFSLLIPTTIIRAVDRPIIQVDFEFDGEMLELLLSQEQRDLIKSNAIEKICQQAEKRWGFLDWSSSPPASATTDFAKWKVTFSVEIKQLQGASDATIGTLMHSGQLQSMQYGFKGNEDRYTVYPIDRTIPYSDPASLSDEINRHLEIQLRTLLEEADVEKFLNQIPIAESVIADTDISRIVVPVKASDLRMDLNSELMVWFKEQDSNGLLELKTKQEVSLENQNKGYIVGWVTELQHDTIKIPSPDWGYEELSPVISTWKDVKVFMVKYNGKLTGCPTTADGQVIDPFDCGEEQ